MNGFTERLELEYLVISDFLRAFGPWRNHIVIGGGYTLMVYKLYLCDQTLSVPPILELQDPTGTLKALHFERVARQIAALDTHKSLN